MLARLLKVGLVTFLGDDPRVNILALVLDFEVGRFFGRLEWLDIYFLCLVIIMTKYIFFMKATTTWIKEKVKYLTFGFVSNTIEINFLFCSQSILEIYEKAFNFSLWKKEFNLNVFMFIINEFA